MASASACAAATSLCGEGDAPGVVPKALQVGEIVGRRRQRQDLLGRAELRVCEKGAALTGCAHGTVRAASSVTTLSSLSAAATVALLARHLRRDEDEVHVVRIVGVGVDAARLPLREVGLVGGRCHLVRFQRVEIAPDAEVDVRRHVDQVAGREVLGRQPVGVGLRTLRLVRGLDGVDVKMDCADMVRVRRQHAFEGGDQVGGPSGGVLPPSAQ